MNLLSLVHYTAFLIYLWLIFFTLSKDPKAKLNRICALIIICFAVWNFSTAFYYMANIEKEAMLWSNIASIGWCSFQGFSVWFSLIFVKKEGILKKWYFQALMFFISTFFIHKQWTGYLSSDIIKLPFGWAAVWSDSIWTWIFFAYILSSISVALGLCYFYGKKTKLKSEKKQAMIIVTTGLISLILGTVTDILLPLLKINFMPPMGNIFILFWIGGLVYAITKYKLMVLTPAYAASDILATMSDSLILVNPKGNLIEANNATLNLLGYSRAEIIGKPVEILFSKETPLLRDAGLDKILKNGSLKDDIVSYRAKNGQSIPISFSGAIMNDQDQHLIGIVGVARDMREIIRLQESERELSVEKARAEALQERAQELQAAYDKLKTIQAQLIQSEKMAAVGQLAGGVAHEINNPVGIILGFAQSIVKRIKDDDPLFLPLKSIEREAVRCKKLVGDLLTFSRSGKSHAEIIDLNQTIDETLSLITIQAKVKNIEIIKMYDTGLPRIMANKNQLQQVIMNLCNNAIDAIDAIDANDKIDASGEIDAKTPQRDGGKIIITTRQSEKFITIEISDNGVGMNQEIKRHIFEPFFTTKEIGKGTGLGLSLCYEILQRHQGGIEVESEAGQGSTFKIKLPL